MGSGEPYQPASFSSDAGLDWWRGWVARTSLLLAAAPVLCKSSQVSQVRQADPFTDRLVSAAGDFSTLFLHAVLLGYSTCTARKERARSRMTFVATRAMAFMNSAPSLARSLAAVAATLL